MKLKNWISIVLLSGLLAISAGADVYVKNKPFKGKVAGSGSATLVEAEPMLAALGVKDYRLEGQQLVVNDKTLSLEDGFISLKSLSEAVGAKVLVNPELGTIDVYQETSQKVAAESPVAASRDSSDGKVKGYVPGSMQRGVWLTDWQAATAESKRSNRPILINFTGSDWCGWCMRLKEEVFDTDAFKSWAGQNVVLMEADFPKRKALAPPLQAQNEQLAQRFQVGGYPSIVFVDPKGQQMGPRYGYQEGGPEAWIKGAEQAMGR